MCTNIQYIYNIYTNILYYNIQYSIMISLIFLVCCVELAWFSFGLQPQFIVQSTKVSTNMQGLTKFSLNMMQIDSIRISIVYGGVSNNKVQNTLIQTNCNNKTSTIYNNNNSNNSNNSTDMPSSRHSHCSIVQNNMMYMYGGVGQNGQLLQDLWQYNISSMQWNIISISNNSIHNCKLAINNNNNNINININNNNNNNNNNIIVVGINNNNILTMSNYDSSNKIWTVLSYIYGASLISQGKIWTNATIFTQTNITNINDNNNNNNIPYNTIKYSSSLFATYVNIHPIYNIYNNNSNIYNSNNNSNNSYILVTNTQILSLNMLTLQIKLLRNIQQNNANNNDQLIDSIISSDWLLIVKYRINNSSKYIVINYYKLTDLCVTTTNQFIVQTKMKVTLFNDNLYFLDQDLLLGYVIYQHCNQSIHLTYPNIQLCFYGQVLCKQGFRGNFCQHPTCPNTLLLKDYTIYTTIIVECNNHGLCLNGQCVCEEDWQGEDCSIYSRKACKGQTVQNWPVNNCECVAGTTGGNNCEVTFCYNDCNSQGTCQPTGKCVCDTGYYGADCSIAIIEFPGATISI